LDDEVVKFWQEFEEDTGERVQAKAMGELFEGNREKGVWFLLVLTDKSFWFKQVPSDNWVTSLFKSRALAPSSKRADEFTLSIPRENLESLIEPGHGLKGWFSKPAFPVLTLSWREGDSVSSRRFSIDPSAELLPRLRDLFKGN
jgi:hypothetical protein